MRLRSGWLLLLLPVTLFLSGCPSMFYPATQMNAQTQEELAGIKSPVSITVEREDNAWGGAIPFVIHDGKKEIGQLGPAGFFEWKREAGYLKLTVTGAARFITGKNLPDEVICEDYLKPGDTHRYLCGLNIDDKVTFWIKPQQEQATKDVLAFCRADEANTIDAYGGFIKSYAKSSRVDEAIRRYERLIEEAGLLTVEAVNDDTIKILRVYRNVLPHGTYASYAEEVIQYYDAEKKPSEKAFAAYLRKWPQGRFEATARNNEAFCSLGEVIDPLLRNALEKTRQSLMSKFKAMSAEMEEDIRQRKRKMPKLWYVKTDLAQPCERLVVNGVIFSGEFHGRMERSPRINHEQYQYTGEVSVDGVTFFLKGGVQPDSPSDMINPQLHQGAWVTRGTDTYIFDGRHWIHGLTNPVFTVSGFVYEK